MSQTFSYELTFDDMVGTITVTTSSTATNEPAMETATTSQQFQGLSTARRSQENMGPVV